MSNPLEAKQIQVTLRPVDRDNWRAIAALEVEEAQRRFVAEPCYYLTMCFYDGAWHPLAIYQGDQVIGMLMWAVDQSDQSCWLGGVFIDRKHQGRGIGKQAMQAAIGMLTDLHGHRHFALSYQPDNAVARRLYASLGFVEGDEWEGDEVVARLSFDSIESARQKRGGTDGA